MVHAKLYVRFPWWSRLYLAALVIAARLGCRFDAEKAVNVPWVCMKVGVK